MVTKPYLELLAADELEAIHNASLRVLQEVGLAIDSEKALKLLADAGCKVSFSEHTVKIQPELVHELRKKLPASVRLYAREPESDLPLTDGEMYTRLSGNCLRVIDLQTGVGRLATTRDQEDFVKLSDALNNVNIISPPFATCDVPPEIRDIYGAECVLRGTRKHAHLPAYSSKNLELIIELASIVAGGADKLAKRPIVSFFGCPERALYYGDVADMIMKAASYNLPVGILPTVVAGGTAPITLAGMLVQSNAEVLCGALLVELTNPGTPVIYSTAPVNMNMKTGSPLLGTIEFGMMLAGIAQLARYYGFPSNVYGFGTDSKTLDEQTAFEKTFSLTLSALSGANIIYGPGVLESDITQSFEQVVIDCELLDTVRRLRRGITVDEQTLGLDVIGRVGPKGHYLRQEHTRNFLRTEYFFPELSDRTTRATWEKTGSKTITVGARERVRKLLAEHQTPELSNEVLSKMKTILRRAEKGIGQKAQRLR